MDAYRKLLVLGLNDILGRGAVSLEAGDESVSEEGHVMADLAGKSSVIAWNGIGFDELRLTVWWDYDHAQHPQANAAGHHQERFKTSQPLAERQHYPKFVGVTVSGWVERRTGKHIQGRGRDKLFDIYTRADMRQALATLPEPQPQGFEPEGKFFL